MDKLKNRLWLTIPLALLILAVLLGTVFLSLSQPVNPQSQEVKRFVIPRGQAVSVIGQRLEEEGLIKNALVFRLIVNKDGLANKIQAGSFDLSPSLTTNELAQELTQGTNDIWVTIPEGWRREEIAQSLGEQELENFSPEEFLNLTTGQEGQLFPDTYLVPREMSTQQFVELLTQTFERKVGDGLAEEIETSAYDFEDALVMASIVEREGRGAEQMRLVAGVLWNRIELGMPLQADATLQYVKGYDTQEDNWWPTPLAADRQLNSVFNTYQHPGLPPAPIASPGVDAIRAALHPAQTSYLYYLHDAEGEIHYANTLEEHNANVREYLLKSE